MNNLALFDLDHTLLPIDSDYEWGQFLVRTNAVDPVEFKRRNDDFYLQYQAGTLDPAEYLEFTLAVLARFPRAQLDAMHAQFMREVVKPAIRPRALALLKQHHDAGDLVAIVTATNLFVAGPIAKELGVDYVIAAVPEEDAQGNLTGKLVGVPTSGAGKITHTQAWLATMGKQLDSFERSHFYSDSHNDIPLLSVVTHPVATNPNAVLASHATNLGWPSLHLFND